MYAMQVQMTDQDSSDRDAAKQRWQEVEQEQGLELCKPELSSGSELSADLDRTPGAKQHHPADHMPKQQRHMQRHGSLPDMPEQIQQGPGDLAHIHVLQVHGLNNHHIQNVSEQQHLIQQLQSEPSLCTSGSGHSIALQEQRDSAISGCCLAAWCEGDHQPQPQALQVSSCRQNAQTSVCH